MTKHGRYRANRQEQERGTLISYARILLLSIYTD